MPLTASFRTLWAGNAAGNLSDGLMFVALPLIAATLTQDPLLVAGLSTVYAAVRLCVVLPIGALVDRWDRRTILWSTNLIRAVALGGLSVLLLAGFGSIPVLYLAIALVGIVEVAADNAAQAVVPALVSSRDLDRANGRISAAQLIADEFVGPPLGGLLFGIAVALPISVASAFYAVAGLLFLALPRTPRRPRPAARPARGSLWADTMQGARRLAGDRLLGPLAIIGGVTSIAYMAPFAILVVYAADVLDVTPTGYGVILAVSALGGLLGSLVAAPIRARIGYRWTIAGSLLLGAASMAGLAGTTSPWLAAVLLAAYILHAVLWGVCVSSLRQRLVLDRYRGRVNAASKLLGLLGLALGSALGGVLAGVFGLAVPFLASAVLFLGCAVAALLLFRPRSRPLPTAVG
ncbi:MFS transporter [Actinoalloteichus fjordicus]|uniref:Arabinose efflux permease family protein n=1 Tax=Actinoalloteichus fjordicus TaxID=1612552 RepID=A0AAC9LGH8_9PSEU|nr:MFS transporter [Actinoalloteichus fjordicus]APU16440.1 arabinose efflux permease family protein [Actinoalloteichus fjordicus]